MEQNKTYKILEFDKILERLSAYTESDFVKKKIDAIVPYTNIDDAKRSQKETTEATITMLKLGVPPVSLSVNDVTGSVKRTEVNGVLQTKELLDISRLLYVSRRIKA